MSVDVLHAVHDCALGISPVTSFSGVKGLGTRTDLSMRLKLFTLATFPFLEAYDVWQAIGG